MKIKYTGTPGEELDSINMYGIEFPRGKWVDVNNTFAKSKLSNHPHFESKPEKEAEDAEVKYDAKAEQKAVDEQAEKNAEAAQAADDLQELKGDKIETAEDWQREFESSVDGANVPPDHTPASAVEYQALEAADQVPNPVVLAEEEEEPAKRGPGRPKKA